MLKKWKSWQRRSIADAGDCKEAGNVTADEVFLACIENQPAADVEPVKHGEWKNNEGIAMCSECGYIPPYDNAIDDIFYSNYCPNCGAKMDG